MMIILKCNVVMLSGNDDNELRALAGDKDCVDADENTSRGRETTHHDNTHNY